MRIFVRILVTIWIVMLVGIAAMTFVPSFSLPLEQEKGRILPLTTLQDCARRAADQYREIGKQAFDQQLPGCYEGRLISPAIPAVTDLAGKPLSHHEITLVRGAQHGTDIALRIVPNGTMVALRSDPASSGSYIYLVSLPLPHHMLMVWQLDRVLRLVVISGLFSMLIAASFVRPITRLSNVAERLGTGDLKARVTFPLTKRKDEVGDLGRAFNKMADRIELLVIRYRHFLAHASHELGSPLTRLNIALALARRKGGSELESEHDRIAQEADRLNNLVQELLLLARLESGNELSRSRMLFDAAEIVRASCEDAAFEATQVRKAITIPRQETFQVRGYPDLVRRALDNVLRNGLRFAQRDGGVQVSYFLLADSATGVIVIEDDGPGIPPGQEESIFEPFVTLPNTNEIIGGSGLGLAIARQAILANGGRISARSVPGSGLTVAIELPVA